MRSTPFKSVARNLASGLIVVEREPIREEEEDEKALETTRNEPMQVIDLSISPVIVQQCARKAVNFSDVAPTIPWFSMCPINETTYGQYN